MVKGNLSPFMIITFSASIGTDLVTEKQVGSHARNGSLVRPCGSTRVKRRPWETAAVVVSTTPLTACKSRLAVTADGIKISVAKALRASIK